MKEIEKITLDLKNTLRTKIAKSSYDMWIKDLEPLRIENNVLTLIAKNELTKEWLNSSFIDEMTNIATDLMGAKTTVIIKSPEDSLENEVVTQQEEANKVAKSNVSDQGFLLDKYTFDNFVIGEGNRFSHAASLAVADTPGEAYNPLFIYGGSGLGKTHLLQAIGHHTREHFPEKKTVIISSENFMNEFVDQIRKNRSEEFRQKYRDVDVLLIDDIQFIAGKEKLQEEFFHTFNSLHNAGKQIVLTSDKPPSEIKTLEERLRTRFTWGLITDISKPDLETRVAILKNKSNAEGTVISNDVLELIADSVDSNVRDLEGALTRVLAYSTIINADIDIDLTRAALKNIVDTGSERRITIQEIQKIVSSHYQVKVEDLKSKTRTKNIAHPRQIAMYLSREFTDISYPKIGQEFGGKDHSTVMHAYEKIKKQLDTDKHLKQQIDNFIKNLKNL